MEVGSARCADRTPQRGVPTRNGRASGYCTQYSGLEDRRVSLNTYARRNGLPAEAVQVGSKPTFAKATAGSLRPPRGRGGRGGGRAGGAPASAAFQNAACVALPTGPKFKARGGAFALARV